jgi:hypothetical protein
MSPWLYMNVGPLNVNNSLSYEAIRQILEKPIFGEIRLFLFRISIKKCR